MNISAVIQSIKTAYQAAFPGKTLYIQLAPGTIKPPYGVLRLGQISPNEQDVINRDWEMTATFYLYHTSDTAIIANAETLVAAFDRNAGLTGVYSSLVQSVDIDNNYTDQGDYWAAVIPVEFRWSSS